MVLLSDLDGMSKTPTEAKEYLAKFEEATDLNWELHPSLPHKVNCGLYNASDYSKNKGKIRDSQASANYIGTISIR